MHTENLISILSATAAVFHVLGLISALDALFWARSAQGSIAWGLSLILLPYVSVPAYWVFGRRRFRGYRRTIADFSRARRAMLAGYRETFAEFYAESVPLSAATENTIERIARMEFTRGNAVELLVDGPATFEAIFTALDHATQYVLVQFYIIRADDLGLQLRGKLLACAGRGVKVYLLFDEIGSTALADSFLGPLVEAGAEVSAFGSRQGWRNFFQFNFRNHRKVVIVDGQTAFVGGLNVGTEYLGLSRRFGPWRDTHAKISGPAVVPIQESFLSDWIWARRTVPEIAWKTPVEPGDARVLPVATGPADTMEVCSLLFSEAIRSAKRRLWIATPYFVPDEAVLSQLRLAALRGVDVRILLPKRPDHLIVWLASFAYLPEVMAYGIRIFHYDAGFMHQKVLLADDTLSIVGTVNLDNRSFRLNFEISVVTADAQVAASVGRMLERDFSKSREETRRAPAEFPFLVLVGSRVARLFSPVL